MNTLTKDFPVELLKQIDPPCLSLYQTTHRYHPDNQQDPIRFKNLVKKLEESLLQKLSKEESAILLKPFLALADDRDFWNHTLDGLAVLGAKGIFRIYNLPRPVAELTIVADSFHTKPLLHVLQSSDRYHVLGLNRKEIKLYEGNRDSLHEIQIHQDVPRTLIDGLGEELTEPRHTVAAYGGTGGTQTAMHHGHGGKTAELDNDAEGFFRLVDQGILEHHSQPTGLPLILASLPEHHHRFYKISNNPLLLDEAIDIHPDALSSIEELRVRAWQVMEPRYLNKLEMLVEEYGNAESAGLGDDELRLVSKAVVEGRISTLLIEADREIPGRINPENGEIEFDDLTHPEVDDIMDDLGILVLKMGGQVVIVPTNKMPSKTGIAAIYRY